MWPIYQLVLGLFFISISIYFIWFARKESKELEKLYGSSKGGLKTPSGKMKLKRSGYTYEMGILGLIVGLILTIGYFTSL